MHGGVKEDNNIELLSGEYFISMHPRLLCSHLLYTFISTLFPATLHGPFRSCSSDASLLGPAPLTISKDQRKTRNSAPDPSPRDVPGYRRIIFDARPASVHARKVGEQGCSKDAFSGYPDNDTLFRSMKTSPAANEIPNVSRDRFAYRPKGKGTRSALDAGLFLPRCSCVFVSRGASARRS